MLTAILVGAAIVGGVTAVGAGVGAATGATVHRVKTGSWEGAGSAAVSGAKTGAAIGAIGGATVATGGALMAAGAGIATGVGAAAGITTAASTAGAAMVGGLATGGAAVGAALTGVTAKTAAIGLTAGIAGASIMNASRSENATALQTGTVQPGDPDFIGPVQDGTTGSTQEANFTSSYGIGEAGVFPTAIAGEGAEISELKRQIGRFIDETNALSRTITESAEILNNIATTVNVDSDLGIGLRNLATRTQNLGAEAYSKLEYLAIFMNDRVSTAEAGIAQSSATIDSLAGKLNNLDF